MDPRLQARLESWHAQIALLEVAEKDYLTLEANEKPLWSSLFLEATGKTVSDREAQVYSNPIWRDFQIGLVAANVECNKQKRILELKQAAFNSTYLHSKNESEAVLRMPKGLT